MKAILGQMSIGDLVSFDLLVGSVVTQNYDRVKIAGVIPASHADKFGEDVYALHAQVFRLLPEGTVDDDPESYQYLVVEYDTGNTRIVGIPWINDKTIKVFTRTSATFKIEDLSQEDANDIRDYIARKGYHVTLTVTNS